ncbi:hypothetical protein [Methylocapsa acidiphila]|uniref:hypothetical protein n=1 Tax=Methylocapsa acidiphila TaxID=133552 RepID=UPI00040D5BCD|nr:hypothetical protein [Methylocapsa acidiphila]
MTKLILAPLENGRLGPLDGPFSLSVEAHGDESQILEIVIGYVRAVAAGVSCYNSRALEESSNLNSYADECFEELADQAPQAAGRLENLTVDCRALGESLKTHPIWRLDRAILRRLPGVKFID